MPADTALSRPPDREPELLGAILDRVLEKYAPADRPPRRRSSLRVRMARALLAIGFRRLALRLLEPRPGEKWDERRSLAIDQMMEEEGRR